MQHSGIFTLHLGSRKIVLLCDPRYKRAFYEAPEEILSHREALESFGFLNSQREDSNRELFDVMHSKLIKVNFVNNVARFLPDFVDLVERAMKEQLAEAVVLGKGKIADVFSFSQTVRL